MSFFIQKFSEWYNNVYFGLSYSRLKRFYLYLCWKLWNLKSFVAFDSYMIIQYNFMYRMYKLKNSVRIF